jgi:hypothetical protein
MRAEDKLRAVGTTPPSNLKHRAISGHNRKPAHYRLPGGDEDSVGDAFQVHLDCLPVVVCVVKGAASEDDMGAAMATLDAFHERREKYVILWDYSKAHRPKGRGIILFAQWLDRNKAIISEDCLGQSMFISQGGFRFVLSSIFLIVPPPAPYHIVGTAKEAVDSAIALSATLSLSSRAITTMRTHLSL